MLISLFVWLLCLISCRENLIEYRAGDMKISIEQGDAWLHDFPLFLGIKKENPPQIAVWVEDMGGHYQSTIYVTHKIATQSWLAAKGNRRKEALPHWCHKRGVKYSDGLYLPTKKEPIVDGISSATPKSGFDIKFMPLRELKRFIVKIEINHSTDFNLNWPKSAREGEVNYSGGKEGSGQPAVVYAANIDLTSEQRIFVAELIGHSSPDGSNGCIYPDTSTLTSALKIVKRITVEVQ